MKDFKFVPSVVEGYEQSVLFILTMPQLVTLVQTSTCEKTTLSIMNVISDNIKEKDVTSVLYLLDETLNGIVFNKNNLYDKLLEPHGVTMQEIEDAECQLCWDTDSMELIIIREIPKDEVIIVENEEETV